MKHLFERLWGKAFFYSLEILTALKMGADFNSCCSLIVDTFRFHLANALHLKRNGGPKGSPKLYRVKLGASPKEIWLRPQSGDLFIFHEIFSSGCYRIPEGLCGRVKTVVDLGANIGMTTLFFNQFFPEAKYFCIEPDPENVSLLKKNTAWMGRRVEVVEGAIDHRSGEKYFGASEWSWGGSLTEKSSLGHPVRCFTMEELIRNYQLNVIDLLKIDIEGTEKDIFRSHESWLRRVKLIVIELHCGYSTDDFQRDIGTYGFKVLTPQMGQGNRMICAIGPEN